MSLLTTAHADFQAIIKSDMGAKWPCVITSPAGVSASFSCRFGDTSQQVNPGTNEVVSGRQLTVAVLLADLETNGMSNIRGIAKETQKPWTVSIDNILGTTGVYKIIESNPDNTLGCMVLWCEVYKEL